MNPIIKCACTVGAVLTISAGAMAAPIQWTIGSGGNDHWYDFVTPAAGLTWTSSRSAALASTHMGLSGYLATVTSAAENSFITSMVSGSTGYLGGTDNDTDSSEGAWIWADGPEAGMQFWAGGVGGSAFGGRYNNWNGGEPNNLGNEDYLHTNFNGPGGWNDIANSGLTVGYFIEYSPSQISVPEPGTLALFGLGFAGLGFARRKRIM